MKTNQSQLSKLYTLFKQLNYAVLFCALSCTSCTENTGTQDQDSDHTNSTPDRTKDNLTSFPDSLRFYDKLFTYKDCDREDLIEISGPLTCSQLTDGVLKFGTTYRSGIGKLDYHPTKIPFNSAQIIDLFKKYSVQSDTGFVFHYGYINGSAEGKIVYILSPGTLDKDSLVQYFPFPLRENNSSDDHYLLLEPDTSGPYQIINKKRFDELTNDYKAKVFVDQSEGWAKVENVKGHPLMVYHNPATLYEFYLEYSSGKNLNLYICHGSLKQTNDTTEVHVPCFVFGNDTLFFPLNNVDYKAMGLGIPFRLKALDIGRLCPPNCGSTNPTGKLN